MMFTRFIAHQARQTFLAVLTAAAAALPAWAQVGLQPATWRIDVASAPAAASADADEVKALVWYPSADRAVAQRLGPFRFEAALGAPVAAGRHPLVLISHGTGGHELAHAWLAEALVRSGFVVVSFRHPGDHYEDRSGVARSGYFERRARQASAVLSALLADAAWAPHVDPTRIAIVGHSAGGHVALALAGAETAPERAVRHCLPGGVGLREDAAMCALAGRRSTESVQALLSAVPDPAQRRVHDARIRAAVAFAPLGIGLAPASLRSVDIPVLIEAPLRDDVLAPHLHGLALCRDMPQARCERSAEAGHFAAFQAGTGPLPSAAGDPSVDPPGFDRATWQRGAARRVTAFLLEALG